MSSELPPPPSISHPIGREDLARVTRILESVAGDLTILSQLSAEERVSLTMAAGKVVWPDKDTVRMRLKASRRDKWENKRKIDRSSRATTGIRAARLSSVFVAPPRQLESSVGDESVTKQAPVSARPRLEQPRACYVCKAEYWEVHSFYDSMCEGCARFNYDKRFQTADLRGRVALITGARLKIGYQAALMLLRAGSSVIVSTRFPQDSALRFIREADFAEWGDRLQIHGLDLRHAPSVETFTKFIDRKWARLDFLINNAAQTVRRPPGFYRHLLEIEERPYAELPREAQKILAHHEEFKAALRGEGPAPAVAMLPDGTSWVSEWHGDKLDPTRALGVTASTAALGVTASTAALGVTASAALSQIPYACDDSQQLDPALFPEGRLDADLQQVDLRKMNSWRMKLADVPTDELLEVQLVNSIAPFILCSKLKPLMMRSPERDKHVVNVSAMEGKFSRHTKTDKHPHTNMAKAALNMMTLTSARDYIQDGIHMNAVDTGWVTDEDAAQISARKQLDHDFQPPLDIVDGAARVLDPIFAGFQTGKHSWGCFLKDYRPTEW